MSLLRAAKDKGVQLLADPRIVQLLQSEAAVNLLSSLAQLPDKLEEIGSGQGERLAKNLGLVTREQFAALEQRLARLEERLAEKSGQDAT